MADVFRTLIMPAAQRQRADDVSKSIYPDAAPGQPSVGGAGMYVTGCSPSGNAPITHYILSGFVAEEFAALLPLQEWVWIDADPGDPPPGRWAKVRDEPGSPAAAVQTAVANGTQVTLAQMNALYGAADITEQAPFVALGRLNLKLVNEGVL